MGFPPPYRRPGGGCAAAPAAPGAAAGARPRPRRAQRPFIVRQARSAERRAAPHRPARRSAPARPTQARPAERRAPERPSQPRGTRGAAGVGAPRRDRARAEHGAAGGGCSPRGRRSAGNRRVYSNSGGARGGRPPVGYSPQGRGDAASRRPAAHRPLPPPASAAAPGRHRRPTTGFPPTCASPGASCVAHVAGGADFPPPGGGEALLLRRYPITPFPSVIFEDPSIKRIFPIWPGGYLLVLPPYLGFGDLLLGYGHEFPPVLLPRDRLNGQLDPTLPRFVTLNPPFPLNKCHAAATSRQSPVWELSRLTEL